jgi:hypothetical protein
MASWPSFVENVPSGLIAEVVDRGKLDLPDWYLGWAPGGAIANDDLLRRAGYHPGARRPRGWAPERQRDVFTKGRYIFDLLMVRGAGEFWTVERREDEALAFEFGPTPIFTGTAEAGMFLCEFCQSDYRP